MVDAQPDGPCFLCRKEGHRYPDPREGHFELVCFGCLGELEGRFGIPGGQTYSVLSIRGATNEVERMRVKRATTGGG